MSMSIVPRPFHGCRVFPADNLVTIDGVPQPLADIGRRRCVVIAALDLDQGTPSAGQVLSQLLLPVYGKPRQQQGSAAATTQDLHQLLLCCDAYLIILTKESLPKCRELQRELAAAGASFRPADAPLAGGGDGMPAPDTSALDGADTLPGWCTAEHLPRCSAASAASAITAFAVTAAA